MMIEIEDCREEYEAEQAALLAKQEAERLAKEEAERAEHQRRVREAAVALARSQHKHRAAIVAAAIAKGSDARTAEDDVAIWIDNVECRFLVNFMQETPSGYRCRRGEGKLRMTVGLYGDRVSYPQKKDGTFNYEAAADKLRSYAAGRNVQQRMEANRSANNSYAALVASEFELPSYSRLVMPASHEVGEVMVDFKQLNATSMSPERARAVLTALRDLGIKLS